MIATLSGEQLGLLFCAGLSLLFSGFLFASARWGKARETRGSRYLVQVVGILGCLQAALLLAGTYLLGVFKGWDLIGAFVLLIAGYLAIWLLGLLHLRSHPSQTTEDR